MPSRSRKKRLFDLFGVVVVTTWLVMIGLLIKRLHYGGPAEAPDEVHVAGTIDAPQREWKEIYHRDKKVGYTVSLIQPFSGGYFVQEEVFLRLNLMGEASSVYTATQCRVDDQFLLKSFNFSMTSGVVRFYLSGKVQGDELVLQTGKGRRRRVQRIRIQRPPMMGATLGYFLKSRNLRVGESFRVPLFDPATLGQKEALVRVVSREPVKINTITYDAFRLETTLWGKPLTSWVGERGTTLKEEGFMGFTIIKSSAANAPRDIEAEGEMDFYEAASVGADRRLPHPGRVNYLKVQIGGLDQVALDPGVLNGGRQRYSNGIMEITREPAALTPTYRVPYDDRDRGMRPFLSPELNIESEESEIVHRASKISGNEKDPLRVLRRLSTWVYQNLQKRPVLSVPSALEVLRTKVGDCNEHATLLTALLRASGIPARLGIGLVYTRGRFFYHAWTEAYVGEWISADATLNQVPADATHIKLVEGNLDRQVEIAGLLGKINLKILDYRYD